LEPQKKRILVVGDSVVEGHGVEYSETFAYQLKKEFEKQNREVLNLGIQGSSFLVHSVNLPRFLYLKPEAIVICLNENDWIDDRIHEIDFKKLPILERPSYFDKSYSSFIFKFRLIQFAYFQYYKFFHSKTNVEKIIHSNFKKLPTLVSGQTELDTFSEKRLLPKEKAKSNFELSKEYINFIISECQKRNVKVFFVNLTYLAYSPGSAIRTNKEFIMDSNKLFESYIKEKNIPYLDASEVVQNFYKQNPDGTFFIVDDEHPTKQAHALFAEEIARWLDDKIR
jgi:lysophospholipase L1-like esterase